MEKIIIVFGIRRENSSVKSVIESHIWHRQAISGSIRMLFLYLKMNIARVFAQMSNLFLFI